MSVDLDTECPLPEFFMAQWVGPLGAIQAGYEGKVCGEKDATELRIAAYRAGLEAAAKECEAHAKWNWGYKQCAVGIRALKKL